MAKLIRYGATPIWGVKDEAGIFVTSFSVDSSVGEYEQMDGSGSTCGWVGYNETINFSLDCNVVYDSAAGTDEEALKTNLSQWLVGQKVTLANEGYIRALINPALLGEGETVETCPITNVVKSANLSLAPGQPASVSASGSAYLFDSSKTTIVE